MGFSVSSSSLRWPRFAGTLSRVQGPVRAVVVPIIGELGEPCFAVTLDQRWLCGSQGEVAFFNSVAAASRFLQLLRVPVGGLAFGSPQTFDEREGWRRQCFRLSAHGLAACRQCAQGELACVREAQELQRQDDRW